MQIGTREITYWQHSPKGWDCKNGSAIVETPVSLTVNGEIWLSFMCTPVNLEAMAVGFLYNEALIEHKDEIVDVRVCDNGENIDVWLSHEIHKPQQWWRTSGCTGGVTSVENESDTRTSNQIDKSLSNPRFEETECPKFLDGFQFKPEQISLWMEQILQAQNLYRLSGGVHTSALSDGLRLLVITEDVGRHNTLDKIAGRCLMEDIHPPQRVLITTGRISSEMMQKASRLGAAVVVSRTAPSILAIEMAEQAGITLVGYARRERFNVYTHSNRLIHD